MGERDTVAGVVSGPWLDGELFLKISRYTAPGPDYGITPRCGLYAVLPTTLPFHGSFPASRTDGGGLFFSREMRKYEATGAVYKRSMLPFAGTVRRVGECLLGF